MITMVILDLFIAFYQTVAKAKVVSSLGSVCMFYLNFLTDFDGVIYSATKIPPHLMLSE